MVQRGMLPLAMIALSSILACGGTDSPPPPQKLKVSVVGWGPPADPASTTSPDYVEGMPLYEGASQVLVKGSIPSENRIVAREAAPISGGSIKMPQLPYDEPIRLDLEVRDSADNVLATGASSIFTITEESSPKALRMMISPINAFAPNKAIFSEQGMRVVKDATLDYRVERLRVRDMGSSQAPWLGRTGHVAVPLEDGRVLIVGGTVNVTSGDIDVPINMSRVYGDVQVYEPSTGYFTDLNLNEDESAPQPNGADRLIEPRAYHTVTPIGNDRFIVSGGYTVRTLPDGSKQTRPVRDLELIDMRAPHGQRVTSVKDSIGQPLQMNLPRAYHRAVYLEDKGLLLLIGGRGQELGTTQAEDEVLSQIEIINIGEQRVVAQLYDTGVARTDHEVLLLGDGSILVAGGRNKDGVLDSTQIITVQGNGVDINDGPAMKQGRYDFGLELVPGGTGKSVVVLGGFLGNGAVSDSVELGVATPAGAFSVLPNQKLTAGRGGLDTLTLPQSNDILIFGGRDTQGATIPTAERLRFNGLANSPPYSFLQGTQGTMVIPRYNASFTYMSNGKVLVFGGVEQQGAMMIITQDKAEIYNPYDPVGEVR